MLEPVLTLGVEMRVGEALKHLEEYLSFNYVAFCSEVEGENVWFGFTVVKFRWLLQDVDLTETLFKALELDEIAGTDTFDGPLYALPEDFVGLVVAGTNVLGYAPGEDKVNLGVHRGPRLAIAQDGIELAHPEPTGDENAASIPVFFATDRTATGRQGPEGLFGNQRADLQFGRIDVSIPPGHERGEIETPKWWKFEFKADPRKHVTLRSADVYDEKDFLAALNEHFERTAEHGALVFVHGYNVGFDDGIRRTAQIAYDLRFKGAPVLYSWPSAGEVLRYTQDETNARWTEPHFTHFLDRLLNYSGAETVHVIAHSMGNRVVSESLRALPAEIDTSRLHQLVLAAPDIDAETFEAMAERFEGKAKQITLYASSQDMALRASKLVHGYQRAGDSQPEVVVVEPVVTIEASHVDTNLMGHSYIGDSKSILADIYHLIESGAPPEQRRFHLKPAEQRGSRYWIFTA